MAGLHRNSPLPTDIRVHRKSRLLEVVFDNGERFELPFEYLRVYTPSAEARGHGPGQEILQTGKRLVEIESVEAVGNYAIRPHFSDGHDSGIYDWDLLYNLGQYHDEFWKNYLERLEQTGQSRDADANRAGDSADAKPHSPCGHRH